MFHPRVYTLARTNSPSPVLVNYLMPQFVQTTIGSGRGIISPCVAFQHVGLLYKSKRGEASRPQGDSPGPWLSQTVPKSRFFVTPLREPTLAEFYSLTDDDVAEPQPPTPLICTYNDTMSYS